MTRILVTGSAGHLGEALLRVLRDCGEDATGLDARASAFTHHVGSITDRTFVKQAMHGVGAVLHTATLHKPHLATHLRQDFIDTNISGTLSLLEEAVAAGAEAFVYTSSTSVFGRALTAASGAPATWITEDVAPIPKNIYGITKLAAEHLCELFHHRFALPCIVLRTSRFFPEADDDPAQRQAYQDDNLKINEFLHRRVDLEDLVSAHLLAVEQARAIGFDRYVISATTPFDIVVEGHTPGADPARAAEVTRMWADSGATWWIEALWGDPNQPVDLDAILRRIRQGPPRFD